MNSARSFQKNVLMADQPAAASPTAFFPSLETRLKSP